MAGQFEVIARDRQVALDVLRPSDRDLQHGMELHADALVVESYGFSPRCAPDGDAVATAIEAGASEAELQDITEDMRMTRCVTDAGERSEFEAAWEASGVTCILQNAGEEGQDPLRLMKRLARYTYVTDMMTPFLSKAVTPDDIVKAKADGKHCLYMTGNGVPLTQDWVSVEDELRYIRVFFQLGVRMMHLTYNRRNMIGDGCAESSNAGLSDFGRSVVKEMNRVGVIVDVAHSSWQTGIDAARASDKPMVASHSGSAALSDHYRCKSDEVMRAIVDTGGTVGVCCIPRFLAGAGDISTMLDHIDYIAQKFGADHVTIGTDVAAASTASNEEWRKIPARRRKRTAWEMYWRPNDGLSAPKWRQDRQVRSMAWTNWPMFTVGMVQRGYSDDDIRKILGGNVLRVARDVFPD